MSPSTVTTTSSREFSTDSINGKKDPTPEKNGDSGVKLVKKIDGAKGKEIKNEWLTSILNVQKQLTAIATELDEISKEIEEISKRLDEIKKNDASKSSTRNTTTSLSSDDPEVSSSQSDEIFEDSAAESGNEKYSTKSNRVVQHNGVNKIHGVMIQNDLYEALKQIQAASKASKLIVDDFNEKVQAGVKNAITALNYLDSNESAKENAELIEKKAELNKRLQALLLDLEKIDLSTGKPNLQIQFGS
jgi:hypothetical protein